MSFRKDKRGGQYSVGHIRSVNEGIKEDTELYETHAEYTRSVVPILRQYFGDTATFLEPCCGRHAISRVLKEGGYDVVERDLYYVDKNGEDVAIAGSAVGHDFFVEGLPDGVDGIVTNPPFSRKHDFFARCCELGKPFCILVSTQMLSCVKFAKSMELWKPTIHLVFPMYKKPFLRSDATHTFVGEVLWVLGNMPTRIETEYQCSFVS